ncbi:MAG: hypothetical protein Q8Q39_04600 [bacterium]|nr:hypothetical protein [bacterium]
MQQGSKKTERTGSAYPVWKSEVRELVYLPRHSPDIAATYTHEPTHVDEAALGNLYALVHIENAAHQEGMLGGSLFLEARRIYYHAHRQQSAEERFRKTLRHLNQYLTGRIEQAANETMWRYHISLMAVCDHTLLIGRIGSAFAYLLRDGKLTLIGKSPNSAQRDDEALDALRPNFGQFARGTLMPRDRVIVLSPHIFDTALTENILQECPNPALPEIRRHMNAHAHAGDHQAYQDHAAAALMLRCTAPGDTSPNFTLESTLSRPLATPTQSTLRKILAGIAIAAQPAESKTAHLPQEPNPAVKLLSKIFVRMRWYWLVPVMAVLGYGAWNTYQRSLSDQIILRTELDRQVASTISNIKESRNQKDALGAYQHLGLLLQHLNENAAYARALEGEHAKYRNLVGGALDRLALQAKSLMPEILADFSAFAIEFEPELLIESEDAYLIMAARPLQFARIERSDNRKTRVVITGLTEPANPLAAARTLEYPPRAVYLDQSHAWYFDPGDKSLREQRVRYPQGFPHDAQLFVSGTYEVYLIPEHGPFARMRLTDAAENKFETLPLPASLKASSWKGAGILTPSLYVVTDDNRLLRFTTGSLRNDTVIDLPTPLGDRDLRIIGLADVQLIALLDSQNKRIVMMTPEGKVTRQYRNDLFTDMRDIIVTQNNTLLILTTTKLLKMPYNK